jgi:cation transporter-like permease
MLSEKYRFIRAGVPNPLVILAAVSIVGGVIAAVVFGVAYLGYDAPAADEDVKMDMSVTGVIVCAFFLSCVTLGIAILRERPGGSPRRSSPPWCSSRWRGACSRPVSSRWASCSLS